MKSGAKLDSNDNFSRSSKIFSDIFSFIYDKHNIDADLARLSGQVFDLESYSMLILGYLGKKGLQTEYDLTQEFSQTYDLRRSSIRRRIMGSPEIVGLGPENFIMIKKKTSFKNTKEKKFYGLTLKGIIGSLSHCYLHDNYVVKKYRTILSGLIGSGGLADLSIIYMKYNIGLILSWYKITKMDLIHREEISTIFLDGMTNYVLYAPIPAEKITEKDWERYIEIGKMFFLLRHLLELFIRQTTPDNIQLNDPKIVRLLKNRPALLEKREFQNFLRRLCMYDWTQYLNFLSKKDLRLDNIPIVSYTRKDMNGGGQWMSLIPEIDQMKDELMNNLGIKDSSMVNIGKISSKKVEIW